MTAAVCAVVGDQVFIAVGDMRGQQDEKLGYRELLANASKPDSRNW
jgi:hypothetical protein